ncbi:hypothetical protein HPB47_025170, partial [Ixodes persulcatus]
MADGAGDELALTGQTGGANTTPEAASEQQIMLLQLQLKIAEAERERQRMELEIQRLQSHRSAEPGEVDSSFAVGAKADEDRRLKFAGLLKGVLAPMPSQKALVPSWFEDVEATLESYEVPREWWAGLVLPRLSERARGLLTRLSSEERRDYAALKSKILDGLRLSAAEYKRLFSGSTKGAKETWEQLSIPATVTSAQGVAVPGDEALCIVLRRLAYPNRLFVLEGVFGRHSSTLSCISNIIMGHINERFGHLLSNMNNHSWLTLAKLEMCSQ